MLQSDFLTTGPEVAAFEAAFARAVGAAEAVAVSSGTAALHIAALALGLGPDTAAVVPSITFVATASVVRLAGGRVIFADVDPDTGLMGPAELEDALARDTTGEVRAVFPVHLNGQPCDMPSIGAIAREKSLKIVEDACHALGGSVAGFAVGAGKTSNLAMFSCHPVKAIAMGEGGVLTTDDSALALHLRRLANHGLTRDPATFVHDDLAFDTGGDPNPWYYELMEPAFNYRASDIHCALGLSQLGKLERFVSRRRELSGLYDARLAQLAPLVRSVPQVSWGQSGRHLHAVLIDFQAAGLSRATVIQRLRASGIGTQVHYIPVHRQPCFRALDPDLTLPGADTYYSRCLSLPLFPAMDDSDVDRVVDALAAVLELKA